MSYTYNGVTIQYCKTVQFQAEEERDPTNSDTLWTKYTIKVKGFVSNESTTFRFDTAQTMRDLRGKLQTPRKELDYRVGNVALVQVLATGGNTPLDCRIGPEPLPTVVTEVTSGVFWVETGVVARVCESDYVEGCTENPVVSLRWTQTESFDENWVSELTTSGKLIVRSDLRQLADNFRTLCTPTILPNYQRMSAKYTLSPDGLQLDFNFIDKEKDRLPPFPATKAAGKFTVTVDQNGGVKRIGECQITLEGMPGTSRKLLMLRALAMAYERILQENAVGVERGQSDILAYFWGRLEEDLFEPKVSVTVAGMLPPLGSGPGMINDDRPIAMGSVGALVGGIGYNFPGIAPPDRKRLAGLLAAAFKDPCACQLFETEMTSAPDGPSFAFNTEMTTPVPANPITVEIGNVTPITQELTTVTFPYLFYEVSVDVVTDSGTIAMPGTGFGDLGNIAAGVKVSGMKAQLVVTWAMGRMGAPCEMPVYETDNPNLVPVRATVTKNNIEMSPDGTTFTHWAAGFYIYEILNPITSQLVTPVPSYLNASAQAAAQVASQFWANLTNNFQGPTESNPFVPGGVNVGTQPPAQPGPDNTITGIDEIPTAFGLLFGQNGYQTLGENTTLGDLYYNAANNAGLYPSVPNVAGVSALSPTVGP